jgi:hypothetical protein
MPPASTGRHIRSVRDRSKQAAKLPGRRVRQQSVRRAILHDFSLVHEKRRDMDDRQRQHQRTMEAILCTRAFGKASARRVFISQIERTNRDHPELAGKLLFEIDN